MKKLMAGLIGVLIPALAQYSLAADVVFSHDFEDAFEGLPKVSHSREDPASGWMRDNWGTNVTRFSRAAENAHSGRASMKMSCLWWNSGMAACLSSRFRIEKGKSYILRAWMRADSLPRDRSVTITVRNAATQDVELAPGQIPPRKWNVHAERRCSVGREWQEFMLDLKPEYDADAEIQLGYESVGTIWLDDVSVVEGSLEKIWAPAPASSDAPRKGNLLYNGSFEVGNAGWGPLKWQPLPGAYNQKNAGRHMDVEVKKTDAYHGQYALRVDSTEWIESEYIHVRPGHEITLSAYMKSDREEIPVSIYFLDGTQIRYARVAMYGTSARVTNKWQRFSVSGRLPVSANNGIVVRIWGGSGVFWVDGVQLEEGGLTPFDTHGRVELGTMKTDSETGVYRRGQVSKVDVLAYGKPGTSLGVESSLEDYNGETRQTFKSRITIDDKGGGSADLEIRLPAPGIYRLISDAPGAKRPAELILAQVTKSAAAYGGLHTDMSQRNLDFVRDSGFGWWRLHDAFHVVRWDEAEPERKGEFLLDHEGLDQALATGVKLLGCLYAVPKWARNYDPKAPGAITTAYHGTFNIEDWKDYVREMVRQYKGRIKHWEIWNEPGHMPGYFTLLKEGYTLIKQEDPTAFVVGGGGLDRQATQYLDGLFSKGALDYMDAYSFHGYLVDGADPWEFGRGLRELMKKHGKVVPLWDTEWSQQCNSFRRISYYGGQGAKRWPTYPYRTAANLVIRHEISERALGVQANFWYRVTKYIPFRRDSGELLTLYEYDYSPRATLPALANTWNLLGDAELVEMRKPSDITRIYTFSHPDGALFAVDAKLPEGLSAQLVLPVNREGEHINVMGERTPVRPRGNQLEFVVNDAPFFVLFSGAAPEEIARAAQTAEFVGMPPAPLVKLLAIDITNQAPDLVRGARYEREVPLGFGTAGWLFSRTRRNLLVFNKRSEFLVFAGTGPSVELQTVPVSDPRIRVFNSLGNRVPINDGGVVIINRAAYIAIGEHCETSVGSPGFAKGPNLLDNPSFEQGEDGKTPVGWNEWTRFSGKSEFVRKKGGHAPGSRGMAALIQSPDDDFAYAEQGVIRPIKAGERYGLEVWLRSQMKIRADVYLAIRADGGNGNPPKNSEKRSRYTIGPTWKKYTAAVTVKEGMTTRHGSFRAIVQIFENPGARVEMDDAELSLIKR